jgi:hypothetical protein
MSETPARTAPLLAADLAARLRERDERADADDRTPAEEWLNDPPRWRSALRKV